MKIKRFIKVILVGLSPELYFTVSFLLVLYYVQSNNDNLEASDYRVCCRCIDSYIQF